MPVKVSRGSFAVVPLHATSVVPSSSLWVILNQLEQVVGSDTAPHGWECNTPDEGVTVLVSAPSFAMVMPHTLYWRNSPTEPFRAGAFLTE